MADPLEMFIDDLRNNIRKIVALKLDAGSIDEYTEEPYDEINQIYVIDVGFNLGDPRILRIKLDINPDP